MLRLSRQRRQYKTAYGNVSTASIGAIQRGLLALEQQGAARFFGEPMLDIADLIQTRDGKGIVNILAADQLMGSPKLYSSFLLWLLAELFEQLPEVGDPEKPKLVFFFDEAHLLFTKRRACSRSRTCVRLIRSKGWGLLRDSEPARHSGVGARPAGNRVQHALRALRQRSEAVRRPPNAASQSS